MREHPSRTRRSIELWNLQQLLVPHLQSLSMYVPDCYRTKSRSPANSTATTRPLIQRISAATATASSGCPPQEPSTRAIRLEPTGPCCCIRRISGAQEQRISPQCILLTSHCCTDCSGQTHIPVPRRILLQCRTESTRNSRMSCYADSRNYEEDKCPRSRIGCVEGFTGSRKQRCGGKRR